MKQFSVYNYEALPNSLKADFNKSLAKRLSSFLNEIKADDVLDYSSVKEFVVSAGEGPNLASFVSNLYSSISSGIQVGSGNQKLFHSILGVITECWDSINK